MKYKILRQSTTKGLEEAINNISETHKPDGNIIVDITGYFAILMVEK